MLLYVLLLVVCLLIIYYQGGGNINNFIIPLFVLFIIIYSFRKIDIYDSFIDGVNDSFKMIKSLFPTMLAMILGVNIFINSGLLNFLTDIFSFLFKLINIPLEVLPIALIRPISGSASLAILNNIYATNGPDSLIGFMASVMQGSTDTTFYILTLYFGSVGIKKIRHALFSGLCADLIGIIASIVVTKIIFS